uniref:Kinesin motor domain-containing protein n=1 Tax=Manihot esculenta TaxID=3983 RepID=A0A2C9UFK6_MANES
MADPDSSANPDTDDFIVVDASCETTQSLETYDAQKLIRSVANDAIDDLSMLGFSETSPDLVICSGSPEIPRTTYGDFPELWDRNKYKGSFELSLENDIEASDKKDAHKSLSVKFSSICQTFDKELSPESSLKLLIKPEKEEKFPENPLLEFLEDTCFAGGDTVRTNAPIGDGQEDGLCLYQTARFGNFSYFFPALEPGNYAVSLHLAEIVFTDGPPRMRMFDALIQEKKKVVSCLDIYAQVGANKPLVISDLKICIYCDEGLSIRFEGVMGSPIVCGISITKDSFAGKFNSAPIFWFRLSQEVKEDYRELLRQVEFQKRELIEMRRALEELKRENQLKSRECQDAWKSLQELQNELMRKSMHVGSLGKESSLFLCRWFSSLRDMTRKLKFLKFLFQLMKMDHIKLSAEAFAYKKCLADMNELRLTIQSKMKEQIDLNEDLKIKFTEGAKERKELYNKVLELKGNIKVFFRCRPLNAEELALGASMAIDFEYAEDGELTVTSNGLYRKTFKFDAVFSPQSDQAEVFEDVAPFATSVLDGYNVCIFAYGQTGTGKTFTMEGTEEPRGVNCRILDEIFHIIKEQNNIFRSLSALGDVISTLATKSPHIPFRNSKLTHLLQDSLGGDSKTLMFVQISPNENDLGETLCSLNFGSRVRGIELGPAQRLLDTAELLRYKQMAKDIQLKKMEETIHGLELKMKEKDFRNKNLQEKVKELESQLLIERKLARQHVDSRIAEQQQQMNPQKDEQHSAAPRRPLANRLLGSNKNSSEHKSTEMGKDQVNSSQPLAENNGYTPCIPVHLTEGIARNIDPTEKENKPNMHEQLGLPEISVRASICTTSQRIPVAPAPVPRRCSLIPLPSMAGLAGLPPPPPLQPLSLCNDMKEDIEGSEANYLPEQTHCNSPKRIKHRTRKLSSILRRSLKRKIQMKSPAQQHLRKGGINVGMEKVRISIGSRGIISHRVLLGNGRRPGMKETQQNRSQREKERGWNIGKNST